MTVFLIGAALMILVLLVILMVPLLSKPRKSQETESLPQANLEIYRDQFKELEDDLARGAITQTEYEESRNELERRVLEETMSEAPVDEVGGKSGVYTFIVLLLIVPLFAALMWVLTQPLGDFRLDGGKYEGVADYSTGQMIKQAGEMHDMEEALNKLKAHLQSDPSDLQGWMMLGRTTLTTRKYSEAVQAFERAYQLAPGNPAIMVDLADAIAMTQGQDLTGKPWELVQRALKADPTNWKALMMAGTDYFNRGDYRMAVMYWERLLKTLPANDGLADGVRASIQEARQIGNIVGPVPDTLNLGSAPEQNDRQTPMMSQLMKGGAAPMGQTPVPQPSKEEAPIQVKTTLSGEITLGEALKDRTEGLSTLYITARPASGGRAPIAMTKIAVLDFPVQFRLDNTMLPPMDMGAGTLDQYKEVVVTARLGKPNSPMPMSGDLEGSTTAPVPIGSSDVKIVLDKITSR